MLCKYVIMYMYVELLILSNRLEETQFQVVNVVQAEDRTELLIPRVCLNKQV